LKEHKIVRVFNAGDIVRIYYNWQEEKGDIEGEAMLLSFDRYGGEFQSLRGTTFLAERWKVRFLNSNFVTHRFIRVKNYKK
jgi:hypothetical protein